MTELWTGVLGQYRVFTPRIPAYQQSRAAKPFAKLVFGQQTTPQTTPQSSKVYDGKHFQIYQSGDAKYRWMVGKTAHGISVVKTIGAHNLLKLGDGWAGPVVYLDLHDEHPFCANWSTEDTQTLSGVPFWALVVTKEDSGTLAGYLQILKGQQGGGVKVFTRCGNRAEMVALGKTMLGLLNGLV